MLRNNLEKGVEVTVEKKSFMRLPTAHHEWYPAGREVVLAQQSHPAIIEKAHEIVLEGITDPLD